MLFLFILNTLFADELEFYEGKKKVASLTIEEMKKLSLPKKIKLSYHHGQSPFKNYECIPFKLILEKAFRGTDNTYSEYIFEALDGYQAFSEASVLEEEGSCLAYKDLDVKKGWEAVGRSGSSPAPFYLVWEGEKQTTANGFPWPWALKKVKKIRFLDRYQALAPRSEKTKRGFKIFKQQCFRCHALNKMGGKIGPDLGAPRKVTDYRSRKFLQGFIKNPQKYRYSKMPAHDHLSDQEIDAVINYIQDFQ